jgi:hypothetical protein
MVASFHHGEDFMMEGYGMGNSVTM